MLKSYLPQSPILQKHIECFYIFNGQENSTFNYLAFPHYNTGLSFIQHSDIHRKEFQIDIVQQLNSDVKIELLGKYFFPVRINYFGKVNEVSIIFKPLGINRFFQESFHSIAPQFSQELQHEEWIKFGISLFDKEIDFKYLEAFLLSKYQDKDEIIRMEYALPFLHDLDFNFSIAHIAEQLGYNLKTFQRHFIKHMSCSPVEYRRIVRFRHSIASKLDIEGVKSLTEITYESAYYDQSYFTKEFKKLTGHNPKDFFKVAKQVDGENIVWKIL